MPIIFAFDHHMMNRCLVRRLSPSASTKIADDAYGLIFSIRITLNENTKSDPNHLAAIEEPNQTAN